jgi:ribonuclease D
MAIQDNDKVSQHTTVVAATEPEPASRWSWIENAEAWAAFEARTRACGRLAIDTEFVRRSTYHAELGLVQLAVQREVWLLDPLALPLRQELGTLLADPAIVKLIHAGGEDIEVLARWTGQRPQALIDTQIASQLCGNGGQMGYQRLVADRLGVQLSKGEQQSDWLRRPLSESQCRYAADDVYYLEPVAEQLLAEVAALGRSDWLAEDCERQIERVLAPASDFPHLSERNAGQYPPDVQYRLCQLLRWRDVEAEKRNKPRGWLLPTATAVALAFAGADNRSALRKAMVEAGRREPDRDAEKFAELLVAAGAMPAEFPLAGAALEGPQKALLTEIRAGLSETAQRLQLAPEFIATRASLEARVRNGHWPETLGGWRLDLLRDI